MAVTFSVPSAPKVYETTYSKFRGVDFSTDPILVDPGRSPWAPNMISDSGGNPEKRLGWRIEKQLVGRINGIYHLYADDADHFIVHVGSTIVDNKGATLKTGVNDDRSNGFVMGGKLYLLTGADYLVYDGTTVKDVSEVAKVPVTSIANKPTGGGVSFDEINLLSPYRENWFAGDGSSKEYQLDATEIDGVESVTVNDVAVTAYTVNKTTGKVTFTTAPASPPIAGQDNVKIKFKKIVDGYADRILKCRFASLYGGTSGDRVFVAGNPKHRATDWYCAVGDPTYFSDLSYTNVGSDENAIVGYLKIGENQAIVKQDNQQDSTIHIRSVSINQDDGTVYFPVKRGFSGIGAISPYAFGYLFDDPIFLSSDGIYAIGSNNIGLERAIRSRSKFIDYKLKKEPNLSEAVSVIWDGKYLLSLGDACYVLDGKQDKAYIKNTYGEYSYECYYWDNIPARVWFEFQGKLLFGTDDGKICMFNSDIERMSRYSDGGTKSGSDIIGGVAINAEWQTRLDDDSDFTRYKTMKKRGCGVLLKPYYRSSVEVLVSTDKDYERRIRGENIDIMTFDDIDFERITFDSSDKPRVIAFNTKVKKYIELQFILRNNELYEGFGVFGVMKRFYYGSFKK